MQPKFVAAAAVAAFAAVGVGCLVFDSVSADESELRIFGAVDMRTVRTAFEESGRILSLAVEEGAGVRAGDELGRIDDERHRIARDEAQASADVAQKELDLLLAGTRQEDIDAARARVRAQQAAYALDARTCVREKGLGAATTKLRLDQACSQADVSRASLEAARKELARLEAGSRPEEIAVARAALVQARQNLTQSEYALRKCILTAPADGVIRARLKEPGDMAGPASPVFELALMRPLWVRAWVDEKNLGRIAMGQKVEVTNDTFPDVRLPGVVGFVSTVAEFTPKTVQTEDIRTSLVYEVRITVDDPQGVLRLGMPVTVTVSSTRP